MKYYSGKTLEEALKSASEELGMDVESIQYKVVEEKKGLFSLGKKVTIGVEEIEDVITFAESYIKDICHALNLEISLKSFYRENLIKILIETDHNSVLIGNNGTSLQSLNELVKLALAVKFDGKYRVLLDIGNYKDKKYSKVIAIAKRAAKEVCRTHIDMQLDPMTPDERKKVHNALSTWKDIKTESVGDGKSRAIVIKWTGEEGPVKPRKPRKHNKESENTPEAPAQEAAESVEE